MALQIDRPGLIVAGVLIFLALLYSVLIMRAPLAWASIVIPLGFLYLVWRFVRAHERIADAMEAGAVADESESEA